MRLEPAHNPGNTGFGATAADAPNWPAARPTVAAPSPASAPGRPEPPPRGRRALTCPQ